MGRLVCDGAEINYEVWDEFGQGPWLTLINGHTRPLNDFRMAGKHFQKQGLRCLAFDNRGAGQSTYSRPFTIADMAQDVIGLWDHLSIPDSHVLGISMGGFIAQLVGQTTPERVGKLVLVSTAQSRDGIATGEVPWGNSLESVQAKLSHYFTNQFRERNMALVSSMAKQIFRAIQDGKFGEDSAAQTRALESFFSDLGKLTMPTLIVHGEDDQVIRQNAAHELHSGIQHAEIEIISGAGHLLLAESPKELYNLVSTFLLK